MFQEELMDHYKFPRHRKVLTVYSFSQEDNNPSCGDRIGIQVLIDNDKIIDIGFQGEGCILSQAACSMLMQEVHGKSIHDLKHLSKDDILSMVGIPLGPTRVKCALLSLEVLKQGIESFLPKEKNNN
jgi:nitrogen fixation protein NifU and related proteins